MSFGVDPKTMSRGAALKEMKAAWRKPRTSDEEFASRRSRAREIEKAHPGVSKEALEYGSGHDMTHHGEGKPYGSA